VPSPLLPLAEVWWLYGIFVLIVIGVLALDLGLLSRQHTEMSFRKAAAWSGLWVLFSLLINLGIHQYAEWRFTNDPRLLAVPGFDPTAAARMLSLEFLTGYLVEYALSVDNIFVFVVIFRFFVIPPKYQHKVLFYGILGAIVFRALFIGIGTALMRYHWVLWIFGGFLVLTGVKMAFTDDELEVHPERNPVIRFFEKHVPVTGKIEGSELFVKLPAPVQPGAVASGARWAATPLFVTVLFLEMTDILFAVDSVPAILGLTKEPLIVFTSNICAVLGLRSMYFLLAGAMGRFHLLNYGLAVILVFVGLKMLFLDNVFGGDDHKLPILLSLGIIGGVLLVSILGSLLFPRKAEPA
jgi:tellurite resistance protein TerC